jgi:type III secretion protein J
MILMALQVVGRWWRVLLITSLLVACSGAVNLVSGLTEAEANEVLGLLLSADISATKTASKTGVGIQVEAGSVSAAIDILHRNGLPRERRSKLGDVFKKENLISSPLEERARYLYALSQELEQTLSSIDGVVTARVHVVLPERAGPLEASTPSSASVFLKFQKGYGVESVVVPVRALVANGIPGLSPDRVAVVLVLAAGAEASGQSAALAKVLFMRVGHESVAALWTLLGVLGAAIVGGVAWGVRFLIRLRQDGVAL